MPSGAAEFRNIGGDQGVGEGVIVGVGMDVGVDEGVAGITVGGPPKAAFWPTPQPRKVTLKTIQSAPAARAPRTRT